MGLVREETANQRNRRGHLSPAAHVEDARAQRSSRKHQRQGLLSTCRWTKRADAVSLPLPSWPQPLLGSQRGVEMGEAENFLLRDTTPTMRLLIASAAEWCGLSSKLRY